MIRTIHLHGALKKFSTKPLKVDADTPRMVVQGLICQLGPMFKKAIREGSFHLIKGKKKGRLSAEDDVNAIDKDTVGMQLGKSEDLHFYPAVKAQSAVVRIVIGVVLLVVGYIFPVLAPYTTPMAAALILGGVAELLAPKPKLNAPVEQAAQNPSFIFNGTVNVTEQGGPPPVVYGRVTRASSLVLSAGLTVENLPL